MDIPLLKFPRDEIIEIIPAAYQNEAKRIHIPGLDSKALPGTPITEGFSIPVALGSLPASGPASGVASGVASGQMSPMTGDINIPLGADLVIERPPEKVINTAKDMVADKVDDED